MIICRVCFNNSDNLIPLISDHVDSIQLVHMFNGFTIINAEDQLPKYVCEACAAHLDAAHAFKKKYEDSIVRFVHQTSNGEETQATMINEDRVYNKDHETLDKDKDVKILTKLIGLDNLPSTDREKSNSGHESSNRHHDLTPHLNVWNERDGNLIENGPNKRSVYNGLAATQAPTQNNNTEYQETNLLPDSITNQEIDDGIPVLVTTNFCCTEIPNQPKEIDKKHVQPKSLFSVDASNVTLQTSKENAEPGDSLVPEVLSKVYHYGYGSKPFKCDVCCRWFKTKDHIKIHLLWHDVEDKRIKCTKCALTFLTRSHFRNHRCSAGLD